jgi:hypothetical protein
MKQPKFAPDSFVYFQGRVLKVGDWQREEGGTISYSLLGKINVPRVREAELRPAPEPPEEI